VASPLVVPDSYAQWSECLDRLSSGLEDESCLRCMAAGRLSWTGGVATLFADRLGQEVNARLRRCSEGLTRDLKSNGGESSVIRAILNARQALFFLDRLVNTPAFPEVIRTHWTDEVKKFAQRAQKNLEDSARSDRTGRLVVLLRNNNLERYRDIQMQPTLAPELALAEVGSSSTSNTVTGVGMRRRTILN
jgi:hypothetical protein